MEEINVISGRVVDAAYRIHKALGPGLTESVLVVEIKSIETIPRVYPKQVLTYLRLLDIRLGLLLDFGAPLMKDGIRRVINGYGESQRTSREPQRTHTDPRSHRES